MKLPRFMLPMLLLAAVARATPEAADRLATEAQEAFEAQDFAKAVELLTKAIQEDPSMASLYANRGSCYDSLGKFDDALRDFDTSLKKTMERSKDPKDKDLVPILYNRGTLLAHAGRLKEAVADLQKALGIDEDSSQIRIDLAWIMATSSNAAVRNPQKALELALEEIKCTGTSPAAADTLAAAQAANGKFDDAVKAEKEALEQGPNPSQRKRYQLHLQLYLDHKPYLEPAKPAG